MKLYLLINFGKDNVNEEKVIFEWENEGTKSLLEEEAPKPAF